MNFFFKKGNYIDSENKGIYVTQKHSERFNYLLHVIMFPGKITGPDKDNNSYSI